MTTHHKIAIPNALNRQLFLWMTERTIRKGEADKNAVLVRELMKHSFRDDLHDNWVNMSWRQLSNLIGQKTYLRQIKRLQEFGVLHRTDSYYAGNEPERFPDKDPFPKAIALSKRYSSHQDCVFWGLTSNQSIQAIDRSFKLNPTTETAKLLADVLPEFDVRISADEFRLIQHRSAWNLENSYSINSGRFFMTEDSFSGRIHTNFTQLQTETRKHIFSNQLNCFCTGLDVSAMQPLLIGHAARERYQPTAQQPVTQTHSLSMSRPFIAATNCYDSANDVEQWIADCENRQIYEKVQRSIPTNRQRFIYHVWGTKKRIPFDTAKMNRKAFKRLMLQVIFDRNEQSVGHPVWDTIKRLYPTIAQFDWDLKSEDYKNAARVSQIQEVEIMIHDIAAEHIRRGIPIITVHDEIVTPLPNETRQIMKEAFARLGLNPTIH